MPQWKYLHKMAKESKYNEKMKKKKVKKNKKVKINIEKRIKKDS